VYGWWPATAAAAAAEAVPASASAEAEAVPAQTLDQRTFQMGT
jgi:hypothetical protein